MTTLTPEDVEAAKERLSDEAAARLELFIQETEDPATFYGADLWEREHRRALIDRAFPEKDVAPADIRQFAVAHRDGVVRSRSKGGQR